MFTRMSESDPMTVKGNGIGLNMCQPGQPYDLPESDANRLSGTRVDGTWVNEALQFAFGSVAAIAIEARCARAA